VALCRATCSDRGKPPANTPCRIVDASRSADDERHVAGFSFGATDLGVEVAAGEGRAGVSNGFGRLVRTVLSAGRTEMVQRVGAEQVLQRAGVTDSAGRDVEADVLCEQCARCTD